MPEPFSPLPLMPPWAFPDPMKQDPLSRHLRDHDDPHETMSKVADGYQPRLTAGANITISADNVISASGGGGGSGGVSGARMNDEYLPVDDGILQIGTVVTDVSGKQDTIKPTDELTVMSVTAKAGPRTTSLTALGLVTGAGSSSQVSLTFPQTGGVIATQDHVSSSYQPKLTAGANITISDDNTISSTASGTVTGATLNGSDVPIQGGTLAFSGVAKTDSDQTFSGDITVDKAGPLVVGSPRTVVSDMSVTVRGGGGLGTTSYSSLGSDGVAVGSGTVYTKYQAGKITHTQDSTSGDPVNTFTFPSESGTLALEGDFLGTSGPQAISDSDSGSASLKVGGDSSNSVSSASGVTVTSSGSSTAYGNGVVTMTHADGTVSEVSIPDRDGDLVVDSDLEPLNVGSLAGINDYLLNSPSEVSGEYQMSRDALNLIRCSGKTEISVSFPASTGRCRDFALVLEGVTPGVNISLGDHDFVVEDDSAFDFTAAQEYVVLSFTEIPGGAFIVGRRDMKTLEET